MTVSGSGCEKSRSRSQRPAPAKRSTSSLAISVTRFSRRSTLRTVKALFTSLRNLRCSGGSAVSIVSTGGYPSFATSATSAEGRPPPSATPKRFEKVSQSRTTSSTAA